MAETILQHRLLCRNIVLSFTLIVYYYTTNYICQNTIGIIHSSSSQTNNLKDYSIISLLLSYRLGISLSQLESFCSLILNYRLFLGVRSHISEFYLSSPVLKNTLKIFFECIKA